MKRKLLVLFAALFAVLMCVSVSAMTLDTAELAEETTETVEAKIVPGINVVNGQEAFENFDAEGQTVPASLTFGSFDAASMAISTDKAKSGTQSLTGKGNGTYPKINFNDIVCEEGRQYFIHINAAVDVDTIPEYCLWVMQDGKIVKDITSPYKTNAPKGEWGEIAVTVTSTGTVPLYIQTKGNGGIFYYDDLAVIPYYKISYIGLDGETVAATEYVLFDANGDIIKHYIPDLSKVEGATGYALTKGGERIGDVTLNNADVTLYALDTNVVTLSTGDKNVNFTVDGEFTFPVASETFEGIENFLVYSDGTSFYKEGAVVAAADVIGKTFTAVCTTYKEFDEKYGELAFLIDYDLVGVDTVPGSAIKEEPVIPSYKNTAFVTSGIVHNDGNGLATGDVTVENGNRVLKLKTKAGDHSYWRMDYTAPAIGKYTAFENVKAELASGDLASIFGNPWHRFLIPGNYKALTVGKPTAEWSTLSTSYTSTTSLIGSGFSYVRSNRNALPTFYKDDYALYVYPSYTIYFKDAADSTTYVKDVLDTSAGNPTTYTFPNPEELGYESENFTKWTNGTKHFAAGEETTIANVQYTVFYPFYQNADAPAMGFTFEGDINESAVEVSKPIYTENIVDDGRDVLLVHWFNGYTDGSGNTTFPTDLRLSFKTNTYSDPAEYNIIQYSVKVPAAWDVVTDGTIVANNDKKKPYWADKTQAPGYTALTSKSSRIFAHSKANGTYLSPVVSVGNPSVTVSDSYSLFEYDKSSAADFLANAGYGFCVDPMQATYGAYVYMDYLRVYRKGVQTITYNTNAPDGATVVKEVSADKNRGLGYGYLLKDVRPEVEGYVFKGWGLTADATETVNSITVDGDETVYAVWAKAEEIATPDVDNTTEIRGTTDLATNGIRFKASIKPSEKEELSEFGFLATREVLLPYTDDTKTARNHEYLTFNHKVNGANASYYVQGVAYDADGGIDMENGNNTDGSTVYTAVVSGIPLENKNEKMVVRSYAKYIVNGNELVVYGNAQSASLYETAKAVKDAGGVAYTNNKDYIDSIVTE